MSRFDVDGESDTPPELWEANVIRAIGGRRGQQALVDLESALLALPEPRLIQGALAYAGEVCAIGAYVLQKRVSKGEERDAVLADLERLSEKAEDYGDYDVTVDAGKKFGLTFTLAWELGATNDEWFGHLTPERRYTSFLIWIRERLIGRPEYEARVGRHAQQPLAKDWTYVPADVTS